MNHSSQPNKKPRSLHKSYREKCHIVQHERHHEECWGCERFHTTYVKATKGATLRGSVMSNIHFMRNAIARYVEYTKGFDAMRNVSAKCRVHERCHCEGLLRKTCRFAIYNTDLTKYTKITTFRWHNIEMVSQSRFWIPW